jgi:GT2 family glycosyltransferase
MSESESLESREVDQIIGAFFLVRRSLFGALGGFDPRFFVYFEEVDFSLRACQAGYRSFYLATATAYHKGGGSSQQAKATRLFYSLRSRLLFGFKHYPFLEAFTLAFLTLTVEVAARLFAALGSMSLSKLVETLQGYTALYVCLCTKKLRWRS